jgi:hypothetical protein
MMFGDVVDSIEEDIEIYIWKWMPAGPICDAIVDMDLLRALCEEVEEMMNMWARQWSFTRL